MTKEQLHNFEREINAYRVLRHPGIVRYVGCVLEHPNLAIVTEYLPRGNVFNLLYMNRVNLPAILRLRISRQVTEVVGFMHGLDPVIAHLDLKTPNVILDSEYNAKLCDFGKTQEIQEGGSLLQGQELLGSPRYMAPELFQGPGATFTEKADIWGLACCLVEILGGPIPYEEVPEVAQIIDCLRRELPPLVPHWFVDSIGSALKQCFLFEPQNRVTAPQLLVALKSLTPQEMEQQGMDKRRTV
jgi:serine/threonine protein kinase